MHQDSILTWYDWQCYLQSPETTTRGQQWADVRWAFTLGTLDLVLEQKWCCVLWPAGPGCQTAPRTRRRCRRPPPGRPRTPGNRSNPPWSLWWKPCAWCRWPTVWCGHTSDTHTLHSQYHIKHGFGHMFALRTSKHKVQQKLSVKLRGNFQVVL